MICQSHSLTAWLSIQYSEWCWLAELKLLAFAVPHHQEHLLCIAGVNHNQHPLGSYLHWCVHISINIIIWSQSITHWLLTNRPLEDTCSHSTGFQFLPSVCLTSLLQISQLLALLLSLSNPLLSWFYWEQATLRHHPLSTQQSQALPNNHIRIIVVPLQIMR